MARTFEEFRTLYDCWNIGGKDTRPYFVEVLEATNSNFLLKARVPVNIVGGPHKDRNYGKWHVPIEVLDYWLSPEAFESVIHINGKLNYDLIREILETGESHKAAQEIISLWNRFDRVILEEGCLKKIITSDDCSFATYGTPLEIGLREFSIPNLYDCVSTSLNEEGWIDTLAVSFVRRDLMR